VSRAGRASRTGDDDEHWLLAAMCASVLSFAVGMGFYDAVSFIQATFLMFMLLGFGCVLLRQTSPGDGATGTRSI